MKTLAWQLSILCCLSISINSYAQTAGPLTELTASPASAAQRKPAAVWDGNQYVVIWEDNRTPSDGIELYLARIDAGGTLLDTNGIRAWNTALPGNQTSPSIANNPSANNVVYAWTDPRSGGTQIYLGRFAPQGAGQIIDPSGFVVSNNGNHAYASIDCTNTACLVAHKQDGSSEIFGRRIATDGSFIDTTSIDLVSNAGGQTLEQEARVLARNSDFVLAWEDDRNAASGNTGSDLFFGTIPVQGTFNPINPQTLVSAPLRQTAPSLAYASSSNEVWSAWQDQRAGNLDIWFGRFSSNGTQLGQNAVSDFTSNEVFPSLAWGANSSLLVWEDFRTAYGSIYGTMIDTNGSTRNAAAFPIMGFLGNAIEQIVVKGPNNDFLVFAVQSTPSPARIYYRLIRDESPAGTVTAPLAQAPADGISTANVNFGPFTGSSGLEIIDGTLFDVSLGGNLSINVSDVDPIRAGHQVPSVNGRVQFGLSTIAVGDVSVTINSVTGNASGQATARFTNVAPTVSQVLLTPSTPSATDNLQLTYLYNDINGSPEGMSEITWTKNNVSQVAFDGQTIIPSSATSSGDRWRALVRPNDGSDFGSIGFSNTLIVGPTPGSNIGDACNYNSDCNSGFCTDSVCCESRCGAGGSDCQACSVAAGSNSNGRCQTVAAGATCRPEFGDCDLPEVCDGMSPICPSNALRAVGTVCRAAAGSCDDAEYCNGVSPSCPADSLMGSGTPCRGRMGSCDEPEFCDGMSPECPSDARIAANTICRNASGPCDEAETCDGINPACPRDGFLAVGTTCRAAVGACDNEEVCDGVNALCPLNTKKVLGDTCRIAVDACDKEEVCDGTSTDCPDDQVQPANVECRPESGDCDQAEYCDGRTNVCPDDLLKDSNSVCREPSSECDLPESCSGTDIDCPNDQAVEDGEPCNDGDSCTEDDQCSAGQCIAGRQVCMEQTPDAGSSMTNLDENNMLPTANEPESILACKCSASPSDSSPGRSPLWTGLFGLTFLLIRRRPSYFVD